MGSTRRPKYLNQQRSCVQVAIDKGQSIIMYFSAYKHVHFNIPQKWLQVYSEIIFNRLIWYDNFKYPLNCFGSHWVSYPGNSTQNYLCSGQFRHAVVRTQALKWKRPIGPDQHRGTIDIYIYHIWTNTNYYRPTSWISHVREIGKPYNL